MREKYTGSMKYLLGVTMSNNAALVSLIGKPKKASCLNSQ